MDTLQVSQEYLKVGNKNDLGLGIMGILEGIRDDPGKITVPQLNKLTTFIKDKTGITIDFELIHDFFGLAILVEPLIGHTGTSGRYQDFPTGNLFASQFQGRLLEGRVDLEKGKVTGGLTDIKFTMYLPVPMVKNTESISFSIEELTAVVLHEIGHAFWGLATIGEYVWMNYFLTEGVEIALGKKSNKYRVSVLDIDYLKREVSDPELAESLKSDPSENNVRKAFIDLKTNRPRDMMYSVSGAGSWKRDEQMADWFAARMGFSRPLATALYQLQKGAGRYYRSPGMFIAVEIAKVLWGALLTMIPARLDVVAKIMISLYMTFHLTENRDWGPYDNPTERIKKIRNQVVSELKIPDQPKELQKSRMDDLKIIDGLLENMNDWLNLLQVIGYVFLPGYRRSRQRLKAEEQLEALMNNNLFADVERLRQLP